jgi:hypothetical protein
MNISTHIPPSNEINKLSFIHNALEKGWSVRKKGKYYIFSRKHNNEIKYFKPSYIYEFVQSNISSYLQS